ncbi:MAG: hypothetical protein SH850_20845 [Planctomycetaceae bacterium]|nr:hypothetical protein [Planctomycetaceae bacterium]
MKLQVAVRPEAEDELIELWRASKHRGVVAAAWNDIEAALRFLPTQAGRPVDFSNLDEALTVQILHRLIALDLTQDNSVWVIVRHPLRAYYTIHPDDQWVRVWLIRSSSLPTTP